MEHKALIIGGGIAAVFIGGLALYKHRASQNTQSTATVQQASIPSASPISTQPDLGAYYSGTIPSSVGSSATPSDPANSGSSATGGGFDISSLLGMFAQGTVNNNAAQIAANAHTSDSAILAGLNIQPGSSVSVTHTASGTVVSSSAVADPREAGLIGIYQSVLGRAPDAGGLAYYEDAMKHNPNVSLSEIANDLRNSAEYKATHKNG